MKLSGSKRSIIALVAGVAIGLMFLGTAAAVRSGKFVYSSPKTGFISLSPSDFTPDNVPGAEYFNDWTVSALTNTDPGACFNAGVNLPQGAIIKWIDFYYDSGPNTDFFGRFIRQDFLAATSVDLGFVNPVDDSGLPTIASAAIAPSVAKVKNAQYAYMVGVCPFDDTAFHGVRIEYTYKSAGD